MKQPSVPKRPYRKPRLKLHGGLPKLTGSKGGDKQDGGGKPRTRATGGPA